jgi:hypothetical protein
MIRVKKKCRRVKLISTVFIIEITSENVTRHLCDS